MYGHCSPKGRKRNQKGVAMENEFIVNERSEFDRIGFVQLSTLVILDERLSNRDIRVYLYLKSYARFKNYCNPSVRRMCREINISNKTVHAALANLGKLGFITKDQSKGEGYSATYWIEPLQKVYCIGEHYEKIRPDVLDSMKERKMHKFVRYIVQRYEGEEIVENTADADAMINALAEVAQKEEQAKANAQKNKAIRDKRKKEYKEAKSKQKAKGKDRDPNVSDIERAYCAKITDKWGEIAAAGRWQGKERGIVSNLIKKYGAWVVLDCLEKVVEEWEDLQERYNIQGYPDLKTISYFSNSWFSELQRGKKNPGGKRKKVLREGEYSGKGRTGLGFF